MQRRGKLLDVPRLIFLELLVVLQLVHAHVGCLDRVDGEQVQDVIVVLLHSHGEALLEHEVESVRLLHELDTAIRAILLHSLDEHGGLLSLLFKLILCLFPLNIHLELLLLA